MLPSTNKEYYYYYYYYYYHYYYYYYYYYIKSYLILLDSTWVGRWQLTVYCVLWVKHPQCLYPW